MNNLNLNIILLFFLNILILSNLKYTAKSVANIASSNTLIMREYSSGDKLAKI